MARVLASRRFRAPAALLLGVLCWPELAWAQSVKLNPTLARDRGAQILDTRFSPDGAWVVYDTQHDGLPYQILSVPTRGELPALLLASTSAQPDVVIGPDSAYLVYTDDAVYSTPIDKHASIQIGGHEVPTGAPGALQLAPDGGRAFYLAEEDGQPAELFVAAVDGSGDPTVVNDPPEGGRVVEFLVGPDGTFVVYVVELDGLGTLYRVPADGSGGALQLSSVFGQGSDVVGGLQFSSDGDRVLYRGDQTTGGVNDLYSVPVDDSANPVRVNANLVGNGRLFEYASASGRVVYRAEETALGRPELFSAPLEGGPAVRLNGPLVNGGSVESEWVITPDGAQVVYLAFQLSQDRSEIFRAPIDGNVPAVRVNAAFQGGRVNGFRLDPAGTRVVFGRGGLSEAWHLRTVFLDGSQDIPLTSSMVFTLGNRGIEISSDGLRVVHRGQREFPGGFGLFSVAIDGLSAPVELSHGPILGDIFVPFLLGPDDRAVYFTPDIHSVSIDGLEEPRRLSAPLTGGPVIGDVRNFRIVDSGRVLFAASGLASNGQDEDPLRPNEIYDIALDGNRPAAQIFPHPVSIWADDVVSYRLTADGSTLVFLAGNENGPFHDVFAMPVDGHLPPVQLNQESLGNDGAFRFDVSPVDDRVVYVCSEENSTRELFVSRADGSSRISLSGNLVPGGIVDVARISPDGTRVVYTADQRVEDQGELFSVPIDASSSPIALHGELIAAGDILDFEIAPDGVRLAYTIDAEVDGMFELHSVPIDGEDPPVRLNLPLPAGGDVHRYQVTPGGLVLYVADQDENDVFELYGVPIDASASAVRISGALVAGGDLPNTGFPDQIFQFTSDETRVVYLADQEIDEVFELFVAATDGSGSPTKLSGALVADGDVASAVAFPAFALTSDDTRVVYRADQEKDGVFELFVVPLDASQPPARIHLPLLGNADVLPGFQVSPDAAWVVFAADLRFDETFDLFAAPIGGGPLRRVSGPLVAGGDAITYWVGPRFEFTPDSRRVIYVGDQDTDEVYELYASFLPRPHVGTAGPTRTVERARD